MSGHAPSSLRRVCRRGLIGLTTATVVALLIAGPVGASIAHSRVVSATPASFTPRVVLGTSGETVYAFAQVGSTMYVGGKFQQIRNSAGTQTYARANFAAFSATTGAVSSLSLPANNVVEVIVPSPDGRAIYIGGHFTSIGGVSIRGMVRFDLTRNAIDTAFQPGLDGIVTDATFVGSRLIIGGTFSRHLRSINPATGADTGYINLSLTGRANPNDVTKVRRFAVNPAGTRWLRSATSPPSPASPRPQAFRVDLTTIPSATLSRLARPPFDRRVRTASPSTAGASTSRRTARTSSS